MAPEYRVLLECAACLGLEFSAEILAGSLRMPRLKLLQLLERVEQDTGIVYDVREKDDLYAFRSSFILEAIRIKFGAREKGPSAPDVPQLIREYHGRVATNLEETLTASYNKVYEVAKHYYASGSLNAEKGMQFCLMASRTARYEFLYEQARKYLAMAQECATVLSKNFAIEQETMIIDLAEANVLGIHRHDTAKKALTYIREQPDAPSIILIGAARACYDAGPDSVDGKMYAESVRIGHMIVANAESKVDRAEGYHFIGISLPPGDFRERENNLRKSLACLKDACADDLPAQALKARVANSLAEQLSKGPADLKAGAETLYWKSIATKERPELYDRPGLARSFGGLGRLYYFKKNKNRRDIRLAQDFFCNDLDYSEMIGDEAGQAQMYSLIAGCKLHEYFIVSNVNEKQVRLEQAIGQYQRSFDKAPGKKDKFFAAIGLIKCYHLKAEKEQIDRIGKTLLSLAQTKDAEEKAGIPNVCSSDFLEVLDLIRVGISASWLDELSALCRPGENE